MKKEDIMYMQWLNLKKVYLYSRIYGKIEIKIIYHGDHICNNGPDFQNAKVLINKVPAYGDIEFHINSIDWFTHNHHLDSKYNNVILHIVYNDNSKLRIITRNNKRVNTYIIKSGYKNFSKSTISHLPCYYFFFKKKLF